MVLPTQEPSDESDEDSNTDCLPTIFQEDVNGSIVEENAIVKCNIVENLNMKTRKKLWRKHMMWWVNFLW